MKHLETMIGVANEARHKGYETGDPLYHAIADLEVMRLVAFGRSLESDELSDESCGYIVEPAVEFAPVWKEALSDALLTGHVVSLPHPLHWISESAVGT